MQLETHRSNAGHSTGDLSATELGRPETGQRVALKAVGRAVHLVSFALRHGRNAVCRLSGSSS
jgi:hypothetical protein